MKNLHKKKKLWHHSYQGLWFVQMGYVYAKFRAWCQSFQPIKEQYQCFVVICLLFSIIVDQQHQVSHSIHTRSYDINTKQLPWSQFIPKLSNILDANASDVMLKQPHKSTLWKTSNYYNDNKTFTLATFCFNPAC